MNYLMEKDQYYTPDIEDLFVGYECEVWDTHAYTPESWRKVKIGQADEYDTGSFPNYGLFIELADNTSRFRTSYITRDQIVAEGWKDITNPLSINTWSFEKGNRFCGFRFNDLKNPFVLYIIVKDPSIEEVTLGVPSEFFKFICPCPSINEFRKICKLLNI